MILFVLVSNIVSTDAIHHDYMGSRASPLRGGGVPKNAELESISFTCVVWNMETFAGIYKEICCNIFYVRNAERKLRKHSE